MRAKRTLCILVSFLFIIVFVYGCSGEGDNVTDGGGGGSDNIDSLLVELSVAFEAMIDTMGTDPDFNLDDFDFTGLNQAFKSYEAGHPGDGKACFGAAITSIMTLMMSENLNALIDTVESMNAGGEWFKRYVPNPLKMSDRRNLMAFPTEITGSGIDPNFLAQSYVALMARVISNPPQISEVQAIVRDEFIPAVEGAIGYIDKIIANPSFVFWVTPAMMGETSDSVEIDNTDFLVFGTGLRLIEAFFHMAVAYDVDVPSYDSAGLTYIFDQSNNWMSLHPNGDDDMLDAFVLFGEAVDMTEDAISSLQSEQSSDLNQSDDLIKADWTMYDYIEAFVTIDSIRYYMSGPQYVQADFNGDGYEESVRVNGSRIFNDPIDGIFNLLPPYTSEVVMETDTILHEDWYWNGYEWVPYYWSEEIEYLVVNITWEANTFSEWVFPNPSINGLFPDITTDGAFKLLFGITSEGWTKEMRLEIGN